MLATADVEILTTVEDVETGLALVVDAVKWRITALNASRKAQETRPIQAVKQVLTMCKHLCSKQRSACNSHKRSGVYFETSYLSTELKGKESQCTCKPRGFRTLPSTPAKQLEYH